MNWRAEGQGHLIFPFVEILIENLLLEGFNLSGSLRYLPKSLQDIALCAQVFWNVGANTQMLYLY